MTNKTFDKYIALIKKKAFTENELISFRRAINDSSIMAQYKIHYLIREFEYNHINLTLDQQYKGINWLRNKTFKLNGQTRKNSPLSYFEQQVIKDFKEFKCVGLYNQSDNQRPFRVCIYRCISIKGLYFDYCVETNGTVKVFAIGDKQGTISYSNQPEFELARKGTQSDRIL